MKRTLVTTHGIKVDSVCSTMWTEFESGIKSFNVVESGVYINWNFGNTFVPWSNVRYIEERY